MSEVKKVLVVDDHFEMLDFLRSMLELSSQNYDVLAVPSAEEGLLELRQKEFDLLITDVRLAGMSGFDLIRRMQTFKPAVPVIMITAYSSVQGEREAAELGVHRYFRKPLDTDEVLAAVHTALYGGLVVHADQPVDTDETTSLMPEEVTRRLETLRTDTGATKISLATSSGKLLLQVGQEQLPNLPALTTLLAENLEKSFLLADELGGNIPTTIQYHSGSELELYIANVGRDYFLTIFYSVQARRGRMGTIWVFAQRAIKDLLTLLPPPEASEPATVPEEESKPAEPSSLDASREQARMATSASSPSEPIASPDLPVEKAAVEAASVGAETAPEEQSGLTAPAETDGYITWETGELHAAHTADTFWGQGLAESKSTEDASGAMSFDEALEQGLVSGESDSEPGADMDIMENASESAGEATDFLELKDSDLENPVALDDFWDMATNEEAAALKDGDGLSLEEAMRQGLVPEEFSEMDVSETNDLAPVQGSHASDGTTDVTSPAEKSSPKKPPSAGVELLKPLDDLNEDVSEDLDAFWNVAVDAQNDDPTTGFSYEEAVRRGLIKEEGEMDDIAE